MPPRWRPGIAVRLFLAILAVCALVALGMGLATRLSFRAGFLDYREAVEEQRLRSLALDLADDYADAGNWNALRDSKNWRQAIGRFIRQEAELRLKDEKNAAPPTAPDRDAQRDARRKERARRDWETAHLRSSLGLLDTDRRTLIAGVPPGPRASWQAVELDGTVVGWLTRDPVAPDITDAIDRRFEQGQRTAGLVIALFSLLLAALAAMIMSRGLIAPLRRITETTTRLADGDFSARVALGGPEASGPDLSGANPSGANLSGANPSGANPSRPDPPHPGPCATNAPERRSHGKTAPPDELELLARQLNHLAGVLENNEQARRTFMAEVAHDLRTPLTILRGEIEALEDGLRPITPEALASLRLEAELLARLVDDIHTLSLADLGVLSFARQDMDLVPCLRAVLAASRDRLAARGLGLEENLPASPLFLEADPARLTQALRNLLENSLRYTDPGGRVRVTCRREEDAARIDILDSPPGVPAERLPRLFERFYTGDAARSRSRSGSGLGLAICKTLIEAQGGRIRALPSALGGLCIRITLPLAPGGSAATPGATPAPAATPGASPAAPAGRKKELP